MKNKTSSPNEIHPIIQEDIQSIVKRLGSRITQLSGRKMLVTGATGLLGSYIVETIAYANSSRILYPSCKVLGLQKSLVTKNSRLGYLLDRDDIQFVSHDAAIEYRSSYIFDYIVHSAGMSAPAYFLADPLGTIDVNVNGIRWILEYAKENNVQSVLYMSSSEVYGNPSAKDIPIPESYPGNASTLGSRSCYISSKRLAETLCYIYFQKYGVPVKIVRPFATYGPGLDMSDRRVMADFIRCGLLRKPIKMLSQGLDTRSYCYIGDATVAFFELLVSSKNGEVFNVASDLEEVSILDLARLVHKICNIKSSVTIQKKEDALIQGAPNKVFPDISKLKKTFGYKPSVDIEEGLRRTIEWNRSINSLN